MGTSGGRVSSLEGTLFRFAEGELGPQPPHFGGDFGSISTVESADIRRVSATLSLFRSFWDFLANFFLLKGAFCSLGATGLF